MKNVLQLIGSFHQGGSERQAVQLTRLLCEDGNVNTLIATLNNEGVLREEAENLGFTEIPEFKLTSFYDANFFRQLKDALDFCAKTRSKSFTRTIFTQMFSEWRRRVWQKFR